MPPRSAKVAQQLAHPADPGRIEPVRGLVEDQHLRIAEQGVGDPEPLTHAQGVVAHPLLRSRPVEPNQVEQLAGAPLVDSHQLRGDGQRLAAAPAAVLRGRVEQDAYAASRIGQVAVAPAQHDRFAAVRLGEPGQQPKRRGLAGAVGAEEPCDGSGLDAERDVVDDRLRAEPLGEVLCFDHGSSVAAGYCHAVGPPG